MKLAPMLLILFFLAVLISPLFTVANEFSTAGFYQVENSPRKVYNFNVGWRFHKGPAADASMIGFDDSDWDVVSTPHGLEYLPVDASGSINYQGEAWYRKHFLTPETMRGQRVFLHFEAIMGKSKIWVNGKLVKQHLGGFLPVIIDISDKVKFGNEKNIVAVLADNSNDGTYPPGKPQTTLDFCYFGGIYRDVWLYSTNPIHITDPNFVDKVASGGVFVHYENLTDAQVDIVVSTHLANTSGKAQTVNVINTVSLADGLNIAFATKTVRINANSDQTVTQTLRIKKPHLWTPDNPYLHKISSEVKQGKTTIDGIATKIGIRKIEFRGKDGFFLNNKHFDDKLVGANRHQEFAYIGNAVPNSLQWRDVKKLRNAGMRVIRSAHYPQDPAFMDACDELGMFIIVATPGWQFWGKNLEFADRVYSDIRNMVRRDRNHPSVILWEPILNETDYPTDFAKNAHDATHQEYPFQGCYTACDYKSKGNEYYDVLYSHPLVYDFVTGNFKDDSLNRKKFGFDFSKYSKSMFCREWGDNVDDWSAQNSTSRMRRSWGERAQLVQAEHYANPGYIFTSWNAMYRMPDHFFGGALWAGIDHNRGYHPDPFYGGLLDAFRQPKYSWYMFQSQRDPKLNVPQIDNGPMIFIANEMTPDSESDVVVYTNCDEVRLSAFGKVVQTIKVKNLGCDIPHPPVVFKNVYHFMDMKQMQRANKHADNKLIAEGIIDGKVVAIATKSPAMKKVKFVLSVDFDGTPLVADGSDIVTVIASLTDQNGTVRSLGVDEVVFEISGEGRLIDAENIGANPRRLEFGTAPCLVQATTKAGKITVKAHALFNGVVVSQPGEISFESVSASDPLLFSELPVAGSKSATKKSSDSSTEELRALKEQNAKLQNELNQIRIKEVENQQLKFEKGNQ